MSLISIFRAFFSGIGILQNAIQHIGIEHQCLDVVAHGLDMDVLIDEFDGLGAKSDARAACPLPLTGFTDS